MTASPVRLSIEHGASTASTEAALPDTLADLLTLAIADARQLDPDDYTPRSVSWHLPLDHGACFVCLAGCLIAGSLNSSPYFNKQPWMFPKRIADKLFCLDLMRCGRWVDAFHTLYGRVPEPPIETALLDLRKPERGNFQDWDDFHAHLDSLESIVPDLRRIESLTVTA